MNKKTEKICREFIDYYLTRSNLINLELIKIYINRGLDVHFQDDILIEIVVSSCRKLDILKYLIENYKYDKDVLEKILYCAIIHCCYDIVKYLINNDIHPSYIILRNVFIIEHMLELKQFKILEILINEGADLSITKLSKKEYFNYIRKNKLNKILNE